MTEKCAHSLRTTCATRSLGPSEFWDRVLEPKAQQGDGDATQVVDFTDASRGSSEAEQLIRNPTGARRQITHIAGGLFLSKILPWDNQRQYSQ